MVRLGLGLGMRLLVELLIRFGLGALLCGWPYGIFYWILRRNNHSYNNLVSEVKVPTYTFPMYITLASSFKYQTYYVGSLTTQQQHSLSSVGLCVPIEYLQKRFNQIRFSRHPHSGCFGSVGRGTCLKWTLPLVAPSCIKRNPMQPCLQVQTLEREM